MANELTAITQARYIKLGYQGKWEKLCLDDGTLRIGYYEVPHLLGLQGDRESIKAIYQGLGKTSGSASNYASQLLDFYQLGTDTIWITFHKGNLHWCIAKPEVSFLGLDKVKFPHGTRSRASISGWQKTSLGGKSLKMTELNGNLVKVASYRQTICSINDEVFDYLLRKLKDEELKEVAVAKTKKLEVLSSIQDLLKRLHPKDFELLVDLIFTRSGWQRIGQLGGTQKEIDSTILLPTTGERAILQIKSRVKKEDLKKDLKGLETWGAARVFYAYHTGQEDLKTERPTVTLLGPKEISEQVLKAGLLDWLIEKVG